jgi:hypothetical protein
MLKYTAQLIATIEQSVGIAINNSCAIAIDHQQFGAPLFKPVYFTTVDKQNDSQSMKRITNNG